MGSFGHPRAGGDPSGFLNFIILDPRLRGDDEFMALYDFYGETCPHCIEMKPLVDKVEKELGVTIERVEVWNNEENAKKLAEIDKGLCGGVPFFWNSEAKTFICGSTEEETLKAWAKGEKVEGIGEAK